MKHRFGSRACSLVFLCACAAGAENRFTLIDYPGASNTQAWGINSRGDIVGYYVGADNNNHGFLLNGGHYTTIDYPGAAVTLVNGINPQGDVVGEFGATATSPHRGVPARSRRCLHSLRLSRRDYNLVRRHQCTRRDYGTVYAG